MDTRPFTRESQSGAAKVHRARHETAGWINLSANLIQRLFGHGVVPDAGPRFGVETEDRSDFRTQSTPRAI